MRGRSHQEIRESLGPYSLGHLDDATERRLQRHLAGCAECRAELAAVAPVAQQLRALGGRQTSGPRRDRTRRPAAPVLAGAAAALAVVAALVGGLVGRASAPPAIAAPVESVRMVAAPAAPPAPEVTSAGLIAHTWGVELLLSGEGFERGEVFRVRFRDAAGDWSPAGEFIGVGGEPLDCRMQSALPRGRAVAVQVLDDAGRPVLQADL